jgi:hypothetical protein
MKTINRNPLAIWSLYLLMVVGAGVAFRFAFDTLFGSGRLSWLGSLLSGAVVGGLGVLFIAVIGSRTQTAEFTHSRRVTGYNMKRVVRREGLAGNRLVGIGMFRLFFQHTDRPWEYKQVTKIGFGQSHRLLEAVGQGWEVVSAIGVEPIKTTHLVRPID